MRKKLSRKLRGDSDGIVDNAGENDQLISQANSSTAERQPPSSPILPSFYENSNLPELQDSPRGESSGNTNNHRLNNDNPDSHAEEDSSPRARQKGAVTKLNDPQQDTQGQEKRMKELQNSIWASSWLCCPTFTNIIKAGYMLSEFHRRGRFEENHQGLNLSSLKQRFHLGITLKSVQSYRNQIVGLVRPFIRVHIVDIDTGFHFKMPTYTPARPKFTRGLRVPDLPGALAWNQELIFDLPYSGLVSERALYLFEILDEQPSLSVRANINNQGLSIYRKVAWGYLIPVGVDGLLNVGLPSLAPEVGEESAFNRLDSSGEWPRTTSDPSNGRQTAAGKDLNVRIQLYDYRSYDGLVGVMQRSALNWPALSESYKSKEEKTYPYDIPPIYLQWKLRRKIQISGAFLKVAIGPRFAPFVNIDDDPADGSDAGSDHSPDDDDKANKSSKQSAGMLYKRRRRVKTKDDRFKMKSAALRRTRGPKDPCYVPDRFLYRLEVGPDGAMVVAFSNTGHLLAVASRAPRFNALLNTTEIVYSLLLYDTDLDEEVWAEEIAHHAVIYDIKWSKNDRYLLTCSADGTCKVFDLVALHPLLALYPGQSSAGGDAISPRLGEDGIAVGGTADGQAAPPSMRPNRVIRAFPPRIKCILSLPASVYAYSGVFQEFGPSLTIASYFNPLGLSSTLNSPLAMVGNGTLEYSQWQEHMNALLQAPVPRIIVGAADGRIRVFDESELTGYIRVIEEADTTSSSKKDGDANSEMVDFSPHDGCVNSIALDERTKYLISADSVGDVLVWRQDSNGWYQLLRKLRKEPLSTATANNAGETDKGGLRRSIDLSSSLNKTMNGNTVTNNTSSKLKPREQFNDGSILSLTIHPDKMKGMMLMMSRQPAVLKVLNLATYKPFHTCESFSGLSAYLVREGSNVFSTGVFYRAGFSADGKYIVACSNVSQEADRPVYKLLVWDSYTGQPVSSLLSQLTFAYPVRSISWHPTQHLLAVAMLGPGAAVVLYSTDSSSVNNINQQQQSQQLYSNIDVGGSTTSLPRVDRSLNGTTGLLPPSAFANESLLPRGTNGNNLTNGLNNVSLGRGGSVRVSSKDSAGSADKDILAYSLLNSQSFVNMRGNVGNAGDLAGEQSSPLMEMSRSNESLLPNMATLQPNQSLLSAGATNKPSTSSLLSLNLSTISESKNELPVSSSGNTQGVAAPVSEAETRINKMARAREILARARAQRAAASAFADVGGDK